MAGDGNGVTFSDQGEAVMWGARAVAAVLVGLWAAALGQTSSRRTASAAPPVKPGEARRAPLYVIRVPVHAGKRAEVVEKRGFIDRKGRVVIEPRFDLALPFREGLAAVATWGRVHFAPGKGSVKIPQWGFIDGTGQYVIKPRYHLASTFSEGLARVEELIDFRVNAYYIDRTGRRADMVAHESIMSSGSFADGLASAKDKRSHKWGFIDRRGRWAIRPRFTQAFRFSGGLALVKLGGTVDRHGLVSGGKYGFVDRSGRFAVEPKFVRAEFFSDGLAPVNVGGKPTAFLGVRGGKWGFIDRRGQFVIRPTFVWARGFADGLAPVNVGGSSAPKGYPLGGRWGFVDKKGRIVIEPQFTDAATFSEGLAAVNVGGDRRDSGSSGKTPPKWGYIDRTGKLAIAARYDGAFAFRDGLAYVLLGKRGRYIGRTGKVIWEEPQLKTPDPSAKPSP